MATSYVDDIEKRLHRWHEVASPVRMFTEHRLAPPRQLPPAFASDVVTLEHWAAELVSLRVADLGRQVEAGKQRISGERDQELARLTETARAELSRLLPESASRLNALLAASALTAQESTNPAWASAAPGRAAGAVDVRLGQFTVAGPDDGVRAALRTQATLRFPFETGIFVDGQGSARNAAISLARSVCARLLAAAPAGKLRFTFIDPVALGQSVADFQHLADYDKQLVGNRPVTSAAEIEARLAELSAHTEMVISEYLRGPVRVH